MEIVYEPKSNKVMFSALDPGDVFKTVGGNVCMKVTPMHGHNTVFLSSGALLPTLEDEKVELLDCELIVK